MLPEDTSPVALTEGITKNLIPQHSGYRDLRSFQAVANTLIRLIHQASYLLRRQLKNLEQQFLKNRGFTERLYAMRKKARG